MVLSGTALDVTIPTPRTTSPTPDIEDRGRVHLDPETKESTDSPQAPIRTQLVLLRGQVMLQPTCSERLASHVCHVRVPTT